MRAAARRKRADYGLDLRGTSLPPEAGTPFRRLAPPARGVPEGPAAREAAPRAAGGSGPGSAAARAPPPSRCRAGASARAGSAWRSPTSPSRAAVCPRPDSPSARPSPSFPSTSAAAGGLRPAAGSFPKQGEWPVLGSSSAVYPRVTVMAGLPQNPPTKLRFPLSSAPRAVA